MSKRLKNRPQGTLVLLLVLLVTLPLGILMVLNGILRLPSAGSDVHVFFTKNEYILNPSADVKAAINADTNTIGFVRLSLSFDPSQVQLTNEVTVSSLFGTIVEKTSYMEANQTGKVIIVAGVSGGQAMPSGTFEFATLPFTKGSNLTSTMLTINVNDVQIVNGEANALSVIATNTKLVGSATSTSLPTPTSEPRPSATPGTQGIVLSASTVKVKGSSGVDLTWSGATTSNVSVYRNSSLLTITPNDGSYTDTTIPRVRGKVKPSYIYQICEVGTSACSEEITINF